MLIEKKSALSGKVNSMDLPITQAQLDAWRQSRRLIQDCFPELNADQREFLLSGSTPEEWDDAFGETDE